MDPDVGFFIGQAKKAAELIKGWTGPIRVFGQYDADGITATSILAKALLRECKTFHVSILKQLTTPAFPLVTVSKEGLLIFLDFGSGQLDFLNTLKDKKIIIVDHHQPQGSPGSHIIQINPLDHDIDENVSSSGTSYLLARSIDAGNKDLSELAIIGAIGDSQADSIEGYWGLMGLNKEILNEAIEANKVSLHKGLRIWGRTMRPIHKALEYSIDPFIPDVSGSQTGAVAFLQGIGIGLKTENGEWRTLSDLTQEEQKKLASEIIIRRLGAGEQNADRVFGDVYELLDRPEEFRDAGEFATMVNACGKMGKAYLGIQLCLGTPEASKKIKQLLEEYRGKIGSAISWIQANRESVWKETEQGSYIFTGDVVSEHLISNVISIIHKNSDSQKPIFGFAACEEGLKISARATDKAVEKGINLKVILSKVSGELGGEGGGHAAASGATIPAGTEAAFMQMADNMLKETLNKVINTKVEHKQIIQVSVDGTSVSASASGTVLEYAQARPQEAGAKGERKAGTAEAQGPEGGKTGSHKGGGDKKVERKGLVQYFSA